VVIKKLPWSLVFSAISVCIEMQTVQFSISLSYINTYRKIQICLVHKCLSFLPSFYNSLSNLKACVIHRANKQKYVTHTIHENELQPRPHQLNPEVKCRIAMGIGFRVSGPDNVTRPTFFDLLLSFRFSYERIL
jgi:hypothetical protein